MWLCLLSCSLAFFVDGVCSLSCSFSFSVGPWGSISGARSVYRLGILAVVRSNLHFTSHHRSTTTSHPSVSSFVRRLLSTVWTSHSPAWTGTPRVPNRARTNRPPSGPPGSGKHRSGKYSTAWSWVLFEGHRQDRALQENGLFPVPTVQQQEQL
jgi:hypothetical protein